MYSFCSPMILSSSTVWKVNRCSTRQPFVVLTFGLAMQSNWETAKSCVGIVIISIACHNVTIPIIAAYGNCAQCGLLTFTSRAKTIRASSNAKFWPKQFLGPWINGTNCIAHRTFSQHSMAQSDTCKAQKFPQTVDRQESPKALDSKIQALGEQTAYHVLSNIFTEMVKLATRNEAFRLPPLRILPLLVDSLQSCDHMGATWHLVPTQDVILAQLPHNHRNNRVAP